jgi:DNA-binding transcriptional MerR regulator
MEFPKHVVNACLDMIKQNMERVIKEQPEMLELFGGQPFKVSDTGVHPKLIADWNRYGLLLKSPEKNRMHRFSLTEFVWVKIIEKMRNYNVLIETIQRFKNENVLFERDNIDEIFKDPRFFESMIEKFGESERKTLEDFFSMSDNVKKFLSTLPIDLFNINQLDGMILFCLMIKKPFSIFLNNQGDSFYFSPAFLEYPELDSEELLNVLSGSYVSISLTEVLAECIAVAPLEKVSKQLKLVTESEAIVLEALQKEDIQSLSIRFNKKGEMDLMEITKMELVDKKARLLELILMNGYQDITMKTANGDIILCKNTRKVKLK